MIRCNAVYGPFAHGDGFASQQRRVGQQILYFAQRRVGRNAVAFCDHNEVAARDLTSGDTPALAIADNQRPGAGQVPQRLQHAFGARFLDNRDHDRHGAERQ